MDDLGVQASNHVPDLEQCLEVVQGREGADQGGNGEKPLPKSLLGVSVEYPPGVAQKVGVETVVIEVLYCEECEELGPSPFHLGDDVEDPRSFHTPSFGRGGHQTLRISA